MSRCRVVVPEQVRLDISDGDFILVRKRLTAGEDIDMKTMAAGPTGLDGKISLDIARIPFAQLLSYLIGWSLVRMDGEPIPYSPDMETDARLSTLRNAIDPETLTEITTALTAHIERVTAEREKEKNALAGRSELKVTSLSAVS